MKKALITGASSGIGRDISIELAKKKYDVILVARNEEALNKLKEEIQTYKVKAEVMVCDVSDKNQCIQLHEDVKKKFGTIDVLVNNAGFGDCGKFVDTDLDKEISMIDTNITGLHILTKLFLQDMVKKNKGHILNVASIASFMPGPLMATYYATKAYVIRLTQALRTELAMMGSKVKVAALCPGPVSTNFSKVANVKFNLSSQSSKWVAKHGVNMMLCNRLVIFTSPFILITRIFAKIIPDQLMGFFCFLVQRKKIYK